MKKYLLYCFFTNDYSKIINTWLEQTAYKFFPEETDILVLTDRPELVVNPHDNVIVKKLSNVSKFRNQELWRKSFCHMQVLNEYKDKYEIFAHIQSNCFLPHGLNDDIITFDKNKLTVIAHTCTDIGIRLADFHCKIGSSGYRPLALYKGVWKHVGMMFGGYDVFYDAVKSCHEMYLKDKKNNLLYKVPYHDESLLNSWCCDNPDKIVVLPRVPSGTLDQMSLIKEPFYLVDKGDLGVYKNLYVIPQYTPNTRFGNHLFLIAACYAHCLRNGYEMKIPRNNELINEILEDKFWTAQKFDFEHNKIYQEPSYSYRPIPNNAIGIIRGFYQSSKYFSDFKNEIREIYQKLISTEKHNDIAAIHIRMGDYLVLSERYKSPTKDYLKRAISLLSDNIKVLQVYSDEVDKAVKLVRQVCKENKYKFKVVGMDCDEIESIRSMTSCSELIMSCSSFSWWAAWLGEQRKIIVDKKWYNDNQLPEQDIYEDNWIKI